MEVDPYNIAYEYLLALGIDFEAIYNNRDGITREQLTILSQAPFFKKDIKANAYKTIHRLHASANKNNIDFAANLQNTLVGTVSAGLMESLENQLPEKQQKEIIIKWIPSSAKEPDPFHALNYGKTMTLDQALQKGLGIRYGCKCSMEIVNNKDAKLLEDFIKDSI